MRRTAFWMAAAAALAAGCGAPALEEAETTAPVPVTVAVAQTETITQVTTVTGTVAAAPGAELTVTAPDAGRVAAIPAGEGERVAAGALLVRFEIPGLDADVAARTAAIEQAEARVATARANAERLAGLFDRGVAARREVEEANRDRADAEATLREARSGAEAARLLAARAEVHAPFAGVIAKRWHNAGDQVEASASDPVLKVIDPARLEVVAAVPVADLPAVAPGAEARVRIPGREETLPARVLTRPVQVDAAGVTAPVRIALGRSTATLAAGLVVDVEVIGDSRRDVVVVPAAAVVREGDEAALFVVDEQDRAHRATVVLGLEANGRVEIVSGVTAGARVVVRGQDGLPDGAQVAVSR